ncbi:MAG: acetyl-CoA C-acyltransferase [Bdellovibrionota bacterium]
MQSISQLPSTEVVIVHGARTPFGAWMGTLANQSATDLAVHASIAAMRVSGVQPEDIDQTIYGNVMQTSPDAAYLARHVALRSGLRQKTIALTLNRLCGSGFESVLQAAQQIILGQAHLILAGGSENMSQAPFWLQRFREGYRLGNAQAIDSLQAGLTDSYNGLPMGVTAENLAQKYAITREDSDAFSLQSQQRVQAALAQDVFAQEITPLTLPGKKQDITLDRDEHPRAQTNLEGLSKLPPVFAKGGIVTAGSSSGIVDGAASVIVASKHEVDRRGLPYLGKSFHTGLLDVIQI